MISTSEFLNSTYKNDLNLYSSLWYFSFLNQGIDLNKEILFLWCSFGSGEYNLLFTVDDLQLSSLLSFDLNLESSILLFLLGVWLSCGFESFDYNVDQSYLIYFIFWQKVYTLSYFIISFLILLYSFSYLVLFSIKL